MVRILADSQLNSAIVTQYPADQCNGHPIIIGIHILTSYVAPWASLTVLLLFTSNYSVKNYTVRNLKSP